MNTITQLQQVFNDNFMAYWRSHVAHVNIMGRNFHSDHELLGGIYEELQGQIDILAELLRSLGAFMPTTLSDVVADSEISDNPVDGDSETLLGIVETDLMQLKSCYEELIRVATEEGYDEISNYAQDRVLAIAKHLWQLAATLS